MSDWPVIKLHNEDLNEERIIMKNTGKTDEVAANWFQLIAPLLSGDLDAAKAAEIKKQICEKGSLSDRTIQHYLASYLAVCPADFSNS